MNFKLKPITLALITSLTLQSCVTQTADGRKLSVKESIKETFNSDDPCSNSKRNIGIVAGAVAGAAIATLVSGDKNKAVTVILGALAGSGLGALIGREIDMRQCEISKIQKKYNAEIEMQPLSISASISKQADNKNNQPELLPMQTQDVGLSVSVIDKEGQPQFKTNSAEVTPESQKLFTEISKQYVVSNDDANKKLYEAVKARRILLIGHTDDTGSSTSNAQLSERRAKNVAKLFKEAGVPQENIFYQGAGETMPIADNATNEGRAKNRRVEIVDLTNEDAFRLYLQNKRVNTEYYRPVQNSNHQTGDASVATKVKNNLESKTVKSNLNKKTHESTANEAGNVENNIKDSSSETVLALDREVPKQTTKSNDLMRAQFDFGGVPVNAKKATLNVGNLETTKPKFSLINEAQASDLGQISTCNSDRPRSVGAVKSLKDDKSYSTSEYLPGVYNSSWSGLANGHLIALTHVAVLRDGNTLARKPDLFIYKDYNGNSNSKSNYTSSPNVNVYKGDKALLYRVFSTGPVECLDIVIPNSNPREAPNSNIVYKKNNELYSSDFNPKLAKK